MATPEERLLDLFRTRQVSFDLPIGLERRVRAHLHRINAEIAIDDVDLEPFDVKADWDLLITLATLAEQALDINEAEAGTRYDHLTGRPRANLEYRPQGASHGRRGSAAAPSAARWRGSIQSFIEGRRLRLAARRARNPDDQGHRGSG